MKIKGHKYKFISSDLINIPQSIFGEVEMDGQMLPCVHNIFGELQSVDGIVVHDEDNKFTLEI